MNDYNPYSQPSDKERRKNELKELEELEKYFDLSLGEKTGIHLKHGVMAGGKGIVITLAGKAGLYFIGKGVDYVADIPGKAIAGVKKEMGILPQSAENCNTCTESLGYTPSTVGDKYINHGFGDWFLGIGLTASLLYGLYKSWEEARNIKEHKQDRRMSAYSIKRQMTHEKKTDDKFTKIMSDIQKIKDRLNIPNDDLEKRVNKQ